MLLTTSLSCAPKKPAILAPLEPFQIQDPVDGKGLFRVTIHTPNGDLTYCSHMIGPNPTKWPTHITQYPKPQDGPAWMGEPKEGEEL